MCGDETPPKTTPRPKKELCADHLGFSLHAAVRIGAGNRSRLARIVRYITQPPIAQSRLSLTNNGDILYRSRNPWRNGKTAVVLDPMTFLARLAAQIPPPRRHMLSYYGVLAAAAARRDQIVPGADNATEHPPSHTAETAHDANEKKKKKKKKRLRPERLPWADLIRKTFLVDLLACKCGGRRRVLSLVCDPASIRRCLSHLGLPTELPQCSTTPIAPDLAVLVAADHSLPLLTTEPRQPPAPLVCTLQPVPGFSHPFDRYHAFAAVTIIR
ncbi:MAG: hypothetical protein GY720_09340 [bacterium]|nr:hypothetical protein [bacterium]